MGSLLITGASGFIGSALVRGMRHEHEITGLSRTPPPTVAGDGIRWIQGDLQSADPASMLAGKVFDGVVHLGAVTGGCSEEDGIAVNVAATRRLIRALLDQGCRRFILASSIAAYGVLTDREPAFFPMHLPMRPDHPCLARDAYGLSKAMMEDVAKYFGRLYPSATFICLRFGAVFDPAKGERSTLPAASLPLWGFASLGAVSISDVVGAIGCCLSADLPPGCRIYNVVGPDNPCREPIGDVLHLLPGAPAEGLDRSAYPVSGQAHAPLYSMSEIRDDIGFIPQVSTRGGTLPSPTLSDH